MQIDEMKDEEIDTSEIAPLDERFFADAKLRLPSNSVSVTVNVDVDVLEWFKAQGKDFQSRINAALRIYAEAHKEQPR
jgi:uncharacterized protein (DUF4415 family)